MVVNFSRISLCLHRRYSLGEVTVEEITKILEDRAFQTKTFNGDPTTKDIRIVPNLDQDYHLGRLLYAERYGQKPRWYLDVFEGPHSYKLESIASEIKIKELKK